MCYLTYRTIQGQNNSVGRLLECHGCNEYKSSVILIQGRGPDNKNFQLCLTCLGNICLVVNDNITHKVPA